MDPQSPIIFNVFPIEGDNGFHLKRGAQKAIKYPSVRLCEDYVTWWVGEEKQDAEVRTHDAEGRVIDVMPFPYQEPSNQLGAPSIRIRS